MNIIHYNKKRAQTPITNILLYILVQEVSICRDCAAKNLPVLFIIRITCAVNRDMGNGKSVGVGVTVAKHMQG